MAAPYIWTEGGGWDGEDTFTMGGIIYTMDADNLAEVPQAHRPEGNYSTASWFVSGLTGRGVLVFRRFVPGQSAVAVGIRCYEMDDAECPDFDLPMAPWEPNPEAMVWADDDDE